MDSLCRSIIIIIVIIVHAHACYQVTVFYLVLCFVLKTLFVVAPYFGRYSFTFGGSGGILAWTVGGGTWLLAMPRKKGEAKVNSAENSESIQPPTVGENSMAEEQGVTEQLLRMLLEERQCCDKAEEWRERQFNGLGLGLGLGNMWHFLFISCVYHGEEFSVLLVMGIAIEWQFQRATTHAQAFYYPVHACAARGKVIVLVTLLDR